MRLAILSSFVLTVLAVTLLSPASADEPALLEISTPVNHSPTAQAAERQFVVRCTFNERQTTGETQTVAAPTITVREGQPATCSTLSQTPFVTGVRQVEDGEAEPVVTIVNEGSTVEVVVTPLSETQVQIDASYQHCSICNVEEVTSPATSDNASPATTQAPQVCTQRSRIVRSVTLGDTIEVKCPTQCCKQAGKAKTCCEEPAKCQDDACCKSEACCQSSVGTTVKLTVEAVDQHEAAITPITASEEKPAPVYPVTYQVGDLLEQYAQEKSNEELQEADFVAVIDSVLTDALVKWNDETEIHTDAKRRALVISQTQAGHERISQVLSEKRDHVADVRKLILR